MVLILRNINNLGGTLMLSNKGFNLWADNYDETVQVSEENDRYPFAGYLGNMLGS